MEFIKGSQYEIYIGLKDQNTYEEIFDESTFAKILCTICKREKIAFSLTNQIGGYSHNKGYTTETSLRVTLIGADLKEVKLIANKLKELINTDTVLITSENCEFGYF